MTTKRVAAAVLVRKLWQFCTVLRDDGLSYPDYVEQLTYLLFLKLAEEQETTRLPPGVSWSTLAMAPTSQIADKYNDTLRGLGRQHGTLGIIFGAAVNKISDPEKLSHLVALVGQTEWTGLSDDLKGDAYEGLLEKNARDTKSGAGQYFTPRPLIDAIIECVAPTRDDVILDPACGTGGFLLAANEFVRSNVPPTSDLPSPANAEVRGVELVRDVARLAAMNLYLHGIDDETQAAPPVTCADALSAPEARFKADVVLSNPPFGVKGTITYSDLDGGLQSLSRTRPDFWTTTSNKQLNFLQHIATALKSGGRAAVVVPDNVLFEAGAAATIRQHLFESFDVHTLLRLPPGLFYASGVTANVLFFDRRRSSRKELWVYDLRTGHRFSLKTNPLEADHLLEFVELYGQPRRRETAATPRWRVFQHSNLAESDWRLDVAWPVESSPSYETSGMDRVRELGVEIAQDLEAALAHVQNALRE